MEAFYAFGTLFLFLPVLYLLARAAQRLAARHAAHKQRPAVAGPRAFRQRFRHPLRH